MSNHWGAVGLISWSSLFLLVYAGQMVASGIISGRRVAGEDDPAVARQGRGPFVLAQVPKSGGLRATD